MIFERVSTEALLAAARKTGASGIGWDQWSREMLIAFVRNRPELCESLTQASTIKTADQASFHE